MGRTAIDATKSLIGTFGQYYNRSSNSFSGIFGSATYPNRALSNLNMNYVGGGFCFYLNIATSNSTKGSVSITYPWTETSSGTSLIGHNRQSFSGAFGYINIQCNVTYPYTFKGWYTLPSGGTLITTSNSVNVYPTDTYISTVWYAQFN
jgi:hypothetical protein